MTTRQVVACDGCGLEVAAGNVDRWGKLITRAPNGKMRHADVCPSCIAKLHGWQNPIVAGTGQNLTAFRRAEAIREAEYAARWAVPA